MIKAVFFDLDGTLADTERQNAEAVARVLAAHGRPMTEEEREFVIGHGWAEIYRHLREHGGIDLSYPDLMRAAAREREKLIAEEGLDVLPGAVDAVRRMTERWRAAVVSGSSREEIDMCLRSLGVLDRFAFFVGAEDTSRGKPFPDGYLLAAERLGVRPAACLVLEDSTAGIKAARAAGMRCVAVRAGNFAGQPQEEADLIVDTLEAVDGSLVARLFGRD